MNDFILYYLWYLKLIVVSCGIIRDNGLILIAQRNSTSSLEANKWEFPGGKVEVLEDPKVCLIREIKEEMNIDIAISSLFDVVYQVYDLGADKIHVILIAYLADFVKGDIAAIDCQNYKWVDPCELSGFDFVVADISLLNKYISSIKSI
ncbi:MAG: (deoxy)nucleoside triphosphate pyrophosphohydrolase [Candidatus Woesearchaeota archaeon]